MSESTLMVAARLLARNHEGYITEDELLDTVWHEQACSDLAAAERPQLDGQALRVFDTHWEYRVTTRPVG